MSVEAQGVENTRLEGKDALAEGLVGGVGAAVGGWVVGRRGQGGGSEKVAAGGEEVLVDVGDIAGRARGGADFGDEVDGCC